MRAVPTARMGAPNSRGDRRQGGFASRGQDERLTDLQLGQLPAEVLRHGKADESNPTLNLMRANVLTDGAAAPIQHLVRPRRADDDRHRIARLAQFREQRTPLSHRPVAHKRHPLRAGANDAGNSSSKVRA